MDRLIWLAWRALYLTIGACAVLVTQSFLPEEPRVATPEAPDYPEPAPTFDVARVPVSQAPVVGSPTDARGRDGLTTTAVRSVATTHMVTSRCSVTGARSC